MSTEPAPPARPATPEDVALRAGVSRATVSRVVNGSPTVGPVLRRAVERAVARTGHVPNRAARSLVTRRTGSIAVVVSEREERDVSGPFVGRVFTDPHCGRVAGGRVAGFRAGPAAHGPAEAGCAGGDFTQDGGATAMRALRERAPGLGRGVRRLRPDGAGRLAGAAVPGGPRLGLTGRPVMRGGAGPAGRRRTRTRRPPGFSAG